MIDLSKFVKMFLHILSPWALGPDGVILAVQDKSEANSGYLYKVFLLIFLRISISHYVKQRIGIRVYTEVYAILNIFDSKRRINSCLSGYLFYRYLRRPGVSSVHLIIHNIYYR